VSDLGAAVETTLTRCLAVRPGEDVLIVADEAKRDIGEALLAGAQRLGADATLALTTARPVNGEEPSRSVVAALAACDVFIAPTSWSISHTQARKAATEAGARGATMPTVTRDMLSRLMTADFDAVARRSRALAELLTASDTAHVTCPHGTDLRIDLTGRTAIADDGDLTQPGAFGNLPCGEGFIAPAGGSGTLVAHSLAGIGLADPPAVLTVEDGALTLAEGAHGAQLLAMLRAAGERGTNLAELGIGTNEQARLSGNILEDEKMLGTVHVAFGASAAIGGTVAVPVHLDVLILDASLTIGDTRVMDAGKLLL
jgi:leucyl aminopeptidase (aminopeptidase T)